MVGIIDLPRVFVRATAVDWAIDWRGQSAGSDVGGGNQIVSAGFPKFVGSLSLVLPRDMVLPFRAILTKLRGRANALRVPMIDPLAGYTSSWAWHQAFLAWQNGSYVDPRPTITVVSSASAGAATIMVDETDQPRPVPVGAILSYGDWPFTVVGRSGSGASVTLTVERLAVAIPSGASVDLLARGLFRVTEETAGQPIYDMARVARPSFSLQEWITR